MVKCGVPCCFCVYGCSYRLCCQCWPTRRRQDCVWGTLAMEQRKHVTRRQVNTYPAQQHHRHPRTTMHRDLLGHGHTHTRDAKLLQAQLYHTHTVDVCMCVNFRTLRTHQTNSSKNSLEGTAAAIYTRMCVRMFIVCFHGRSGSVLACSRVYGLM